MDDSRFPVHNTPPPLIHVKGSHREIGRQIGALIGYLRRSGIRGSRYKPQASDPEAGE